MEVAYHRGDFKEAEKLYKGRNKHVPDWAYPYHRYFA
jgi:hypothetical protein